VSVLHRGALFTGWPTIWARSGSGGESSAALPCNLTRPCGRKGLSLALSYEKPRRHPQARREFSAR